MDCKEEQGLSMVLWRCRRGMLELDVMLKKFAEDIFPFIKSEKQQLFMELLEEADQDLHRWLTGGQPCEKSKFQDMLLVIRHLYP